jgi:hypothetical protein
LESFLVDFDSKLDMVLSILPFCSEEKKHEIASFLETSEKSSRKITFGKPDAEYVARLHELKEPSP